MEIRELTPDHGALLAAFRCASTDEHYAQTAELMVTENLEPCLRLDPNLSAIGGWVDDELVAVAAWVTDGQAPPTWTLAVLAVALGHKKRGYGREMKLEVLGRALGAGVRTVVSVVHEDNSPMHWLNRNLPGGTFERDPVHPEYFLWSFRLGESP